LPRLLAGAGGTMVGAIGYDGFFLLSGFVSLAAIPLLPLLARVVARPEDHA
jgi:PAT family beta-lactamase induction signal transducer AmpG